MHSPNFSFRRYGEYIKNGGLFMNAEGLLVMAAMTRHSAYAPYSHFKVGAALLTEKGKIYTGCNIENAAYTPSNCAERTAFFKAVSDGEREFRAIAIVGGKEGVDEYDFCAPCGVCRQVMMEFCNPDEFEIVLGNSAGDIKVVKLKDMFPMGFGPENLD